MKELSYLSNVCLLCACSLESSFVFAAAADDLRVNGFITVTAQRSNQREQVYAPGFSVITREQLQENRGVPGDSVTLGGSTMGLQIDYMMDSKTSFTTQLVSLAGNDWSVQTDWAYAAYKITPTWIFKAGRMRSPMFLFSESQDIGFSYPWVKAPAEMYTFLLPSFDGAALQKRYYISQVAGNVTLALGTSHQAKGQGALPNNLDLKNSAGISSNAYFRSWMFFVSHHIVTVMPNERAGDDMDLALKYLSDQTRLFDYSDVSSGRDYHAQYSDVGFSYDDGSLMVIGEIGRLLVQGSAFPSFKAGDLTVGYRFNNLLPYYSAGYVKTLPDANQLRSAIVESVNVVRNQSEIGAMFDQIKLIGNLNYQQLGQSIGVRVDIGQYTDFKLQVTHVSNLDGSRGLFAPEAPQGGSANIYAISFDAVF